MYLNVLFPFNVLIKVKNKLALGFSYFFIYDYEARYFLACKGLICVFALLHTLG